MPDYKQSDIAGTKWTRAVKLNIINQLNSTPVIYIEEEEIINVGDDVIRKPTGVLTCKFDPENASHVELYDKLNALYVVLREERDLQTVENP